MADWGLGRLEAAGKGLEYACWGPPPGDAPTLVLLHEGLGCVALWRDVPKQLAAATGFRVFVPVLLAAMAAVLVLALLTVIRQARRAAAANPIDAIRCE